MNEHVSGFVSLLGRPNAGKSTLLNALVGAKVAIVADKPQTTRTTIQGVWTTPRAQVVFIDTPGIHQADSVFSQRMMQSIQEALDQRDLLIYLHDATRAPGAADESALALIKAARTPALLALTKIDKLARKDDLLPTIEWFRERHEFEEFLPVAAPKGVGLDDLREAVLRRLPPGDPFFPEDFYTDQPERFIAAEIIREKILALTRQEVPHSVAVLVDQWEDTPKITNVAATIHVERPGQKAIVLGTKAERLKRIGTEARLELEAMLGRRFFLHLFVKVSPKWRENPAFLRELDWRAQLGVETMRLSGDNEEE
ncbi:MAG: GTPase Era [Bryobacteraceae bacterium]|nr:GTPase Era [Bryobacteraceae bacterium]